MALCLVVKTAFPPLYKRPRCEQQPLQSLTPAHPCTVTDTPPEVSTLRLVIPTGFATSVRPQVEMKASPGGKCFAKTIPGLRGCWKAPTRVCPGSRLRRPEDSLLSILCVSQFLSSATGLGRFLFQREETKSGKTKKKGAPTTWGSSLEQLANLTIWKVLLALNFLL